MLVDDLGRVRAGGRDFANVCKARLDQRRHQLVRLVLGDRVRLAGDDLAGPTIVGASVRSAGDITDASRQTLLTRAKSRALVDRFVGQLVASVGNLAALVSEPGYVARLCSLSRGRRG